MNDKGSPFFHGMLYRLHIRGRGDASWPELVHGDELLQTEAGLET
jgi:hypothetical protein